MAIRIKAPNPAVLLRAIRQEILQGNVLTWELYTDGTFTHCADQWDQRAYFTPRVFQKILRFNLIPGSEDPVQGDTYGLYHGRFVEMLTTHHSHRLNWIQVVPHNRRV